MSHTTPYPAAEQRAGHLRNVLAAAGVYLDAIGLRTVAWLAARPTDQAVIVAGWVSQAHTAGAMAERRRQRLASRSAADDREDPVTGLPLPPYVDGWKPEGAR